MNGSRHSADHDYDVLGVAPDATDEEINSAFFHLIDEQGFKAGVPLRDQWARAREIKAAYARLMGSEKAEPAGDWSKSESYRPAANRTIDLGDADAATLHRRPAPAYLATSPAEPAARVADEPPSASNRTFAIASVLGLGLLLLAPWAVWGPNPFSAVAPSEDTSVPLPGPGRVTAPQFSQPSSGSTDLLPSSDNPTAPAAGPPGPRPAPEANIAQAASGPGKTDTEAAGLASHSEPAATTAVPGSPPEAGEQAIAAASPAAPEAVIVASPPPPRIASPTTASPPRAASAPGPVRTPARWLGGGPTDADNPRGRYNGTVAVQVAVAPNGRVANCSAVRSSGTPALDALTCRLVVERARFRPAVDANGRAVQSEAFTTIAWGSRRRH